MIQVIRVIVRTLLLPCIQWVMIQVTERYETNYETNSFFSVEISWITRITEQSVQTNNDHHDHHGLNDHHMSIMIKFKRLTISSKILILYA